MKNPDYKKTLQLGAALGITVLASSGANAATRTWNGNTDTNYNLTSNWSGGDVPDANDTGILEGDGTGITDLAGGISPGTANALNVRGGHVFNINNDGGSLSVNANVNVGRGVAGDGSEINHSGGAFNIGGLDMGGNATGGMSSYTLSGTASLSIDAGASARDFDIGGDVGSGDFDTTFAIEGDVATVSLNATPVLLRSSAIIDLTLGASGIDTIDTTGGFTLQSGAVLTVDGSSYSGGAGTITLFSYGSRTNTTEFTTENITGFTGYDVDVVHDEDSIDLVLVAGDPGGLAVTSFGADTYTISPGDPVTLSWTTQSATTVTLDAAPVAASGNTVVNPITTTTYTLSAGDGVGTVNDTITIQVLPVINSFTADDIQVGTGDPVSLSWSVSGADTLTLDPGGIDVTAVTPPYVVNPTSSETYTLTATNASGSVESDVVVSVGPVIDSFSGSQQYVFSGGLVTLGWVADDFTSLTLTTDNLIDPPVDSDVTSDSSVDVNPTQNMLYTLTASDGVNADVIATFEVVIMPEYPVIPSGPTISVNFHVDDLDALADHQLTMGETAGFVPVDGEFWTNINLGAPSNHEGEALFPSTQLIDDTGNANAATIAPSVDSSYFVGYAASAASEALELGLPGDDDNLFNSYLALNGPNGDGSPADLAILNISGLGSEYTSGGYTLIVYSDSDRRNDSANKRQSLYTLTPSGGGVVSAFVEDDDPAHGINIFDNTYVFSDYVDDGDDYSNFVIFEGLTAASFSLEITSPDGGRGAISGFQIIGGTGLPADPLKLSVVGNGANLDFEWNSLAGMSYNLRGSASLDSDPATWPIVSGQNDILATPPNNTVSIPRPVDDKFFYVVEEFPAP